VVSKPTPPGKLAAGGPPKNDGFGKRIPFGDHPAKKFNDGLEKVTSLQKPMAMFRVSLRSISGIFNIAIAGSNPYFLIGNTSSLKSMGPFSSQLC